MKKLKLLIVALCIIPLSSVLVACDDNNCNKEHLDDHICATECERKHCADGDCEPCDRNHCDNGDCTPCTHDGYELICAHTWEEWIVINATCTDDGLKVFQCENNPEHIKVEIIGKHCVDTNDDCLCDECGEPIPCEKDEFCLCANCGKVTHDF